MGTSDKCLGIHPLTSNILEIMISVTGLNHSKEKDIFQHCLLIKTMCQ